MTTKERILALRDNVNLKIGREIHIAAGITIGDLFDAYTSQTERLVAALESHPEDSEGAIEGYVRLQNEVAEIIGDIGDEKSRPIRIVIDGGLVQGITNIPAGIVIEVLDYDVEGADRTHPNMAKDQDDKWMFQNIWTSHGKSK